MRPLRIAAVSYLNTFPFVYGLKESGILRDFELELAVPSVCAARLKTGEADIALVPAGALPEIDGYRIVSDFCIGATGPVKTVLLLSKKPLEEIRTIHLDNDSRTSVELVKVLAANQWKINPVWENLRPGEASSSTDLEAVVAIGDKTFTLREHYPYVYDLAEGWIEMTGLPFVFAVWITREEIPQEMMASFSAALAYGVERKRETLEYFRGGLPACDDCFGYLEHNISYPLDEAKRKGLGRFLGYLSNRINEQSNNRVIE